MEVFTDYVCPWCYLGNSRMKRLKQEFDILIQVVHFPLHPETPTEGRLLQELFECDLKEIKAKNIQMKNLMIAEGLAYNDRTHTYNSRLAQEVGMWAESQMMADNIHDKFYQAYFVEGRNIGDIEVIIEIIKSIGLDEDEGRAIIAERRYADGVDSNWTKSRNNNIYGVPTYAIDGHTLGGAQPYNVLQEFMYKVGAKKRHV